MRWLTREWQSGELPAGERETRWQTYLDHRDTTSIHLPQALHRLAAAGVDGALTLHRAVPEWWVVEPGKSLTLAVITGDDGHDPAAGPQRVVLQYAGNFELVDATSEAVDEWLTVPDAHLLYDEIEVLPGRRFEQRFLLAPAGELTIRFDSVLLVSAPTSHAERDALVSRRAGAVATEPAVAPTPTRGPEQTPTPRPSPEPEPAPEPAAVSDPPEGSPAPVPATTDSIELTASGKRSLRDTLLSWLPGVRGSRS